MKCQNRKDTKIQKNVLVEGKKQMWDIHHDHSQTYGSSFRHMVRSKLSPPLKLSIAMCLQVGEEMMDIILDEGFKS